MNTPHSTANSIREDQFISARTHKYYTGHSIVLFNYRQGLKKGRYDGVVFVIYIFSY